MTYCDECDRKIDGLPFHCRRCGHEYCSKHRLPESHDCPGLRSKHKLRNDWKEKFDSSARVTKSNALLYTPPSRPVRMPNIPIWVIAIIILIFIGGFAYNENPNVFEETTDSIQDSIPDTSSIEMPRSPAQPDINIASLEMEVHNGINRERRINGLPELNWDSDLGNIARTHSEDMASRNYFEHDSPEGCDPTCRGSKIGYRCYKDYGSYYMEGVAENIYQGNLYDSITYLNGIPIHDWNDAEEIAHQTVQGWMNSPGHRENILTDTYTEGGIGIAISDDSEVLVTQDFC
jgi:uncharacterized protein YkwD